MLIIAITTWISLVFFVGVLPPTIDLYRYATSNPIALFITFTLSVAALSIGFFLMIYTENEIANAVGILVLLLSAIVIITIFPKIIETVLQSFGEPLDKAIRRLFNLR